MKEKLINAFKERTVKSAIEGFIVECKDDITNDVRVYLDSLSIEELEDIQNFLRKLLNLCYDGKLLDEDVAEEDLKLINSLTDEEKFLLKETIIYFSGRLKVKVDLNMLKKAYYLDNNKYIKLNITFASLSTFDEEIEKDFISKLIPGSEYDSMVRSWTMAFFKDVDNPYEYEDNGTDNWDVAKTPRIKRLSINDSTNPKFSKAMAFRLLDLVVIYLFLENRKTDSLTDEEKEIIRSANINYALYSEDKKERMEEYKRKILK